jgi:hypothetical protein
MKNIVLLILVSVVVVAVAAMAFWSSREPAAPGEKVATITVYHSPTCGCCKDWMEHLRDEGFAVQAEAVADMQHIKQREGVPPAMASCHTALVDGYVVEGHVPAADIRRLLEERPAVAGIAVPQMPVGSPGMEMGDRRDPYAVLAFTGDGKSRVYNHYPGN